MKKERDYINDLVNAYRFLSKRVNKKRFTFKQNGKKYEIKEVD